MSREGECAKWWVGRRRIRHREDEEAAAYVAWKTTPLSYEFLVRPRSAGRRRQRVGGVTQVAPVPLPPRPRRLAPRRWIAAKRDLATYLLALIKIRLDSVKRMSQIQNTS